MPETRKLQRIGKNTLYVSLPRQWTSKMRLNQGDRVMLIPRLDDSIVIYPATTSGKPPEIILRVDAKNSKQSLKREIVAAYVDGFDLIKLRKEEKISEEEQEVIREAVDHLFGLEIIEISGDTVTIQCLLGQTLPVDKTLQRIHNVISSMFEETVVALREQDTGSITGLSRRMHDIKRLSLVTNRLLRSLVVFPKPKNEMRISLIDCVDYLQVLHLLSEIAFDVNNASESVVGLSQQWLPKQISEPLCQMCATIKQLYGNSVRALLSKNIQLANQILDNMPSSELNLEELWKRCKADKSEISHLALSHTYLLITSLKRIDQHSVRIAEIAIDRVEAIAANS